MNLELLESFGQNYPEEFDGSLDCISMAVTCQFNRYGTLFAVGCNDGRIVIWDFLTRGIAKIITAHVHPVCSLSWSRNGSKLVSASTDNNVSVWDILSGECEHRLRFPSPVLRVQFNPRVPTELLVVPMRHAALLVKLETDKSNPCSPGEAGVSSLSPSGSASHRLVPVDEDSDLHIFATFDRRGKHIVTGNSKGRLMIVEREGLKVLKQFKVTQTLNNAVKGIEFSRRGESFLVNTSDRVIRVFSTKQVMNCEEGVDPEPCQKLQDLVNKTMWKKCCFSGDGEYVCAGSARQHALYIWEKSVGNLVKILHGTKGEMLLDVVWHPVRPIVASISSGVISVWAQQQVENWSAFAPDFKELDENVEYEERESEFDIEDEDKSVKEDAEELEGLDDDVDVDNTKPIPAFCSSDEEGEDNAALLYLPIAPEIEDPEDGTNNDESSDSPAGKRSNQSNSDSKENVSPKKRKMRTTDIQLENAPQDEVHPLLHKTGSKDRNSSKKPQGRPPNKEKGKSKGK